MANADYDYHQALGLEPINDSVIPDAQAAKPNSLGITMESGGMGSSPKARMAARKRS